MTKHMLIIKVARGEIVAELRNGAASRLGQWRRSVPRSHPDVRIRRTRLSDKSSTARGAPGKALAQALERAAKALADLRTRHRSATLDMVASGKLNRDASDGARRWRGAHEPACASRIARGRAS
jgi:hypothetical protein